MSTFIEIQCDGCGEMSQSLTGDDNLPEGWYRLEATDHHGEAVTSEDFCASCYEAVQNAATTALDIIRVRGRATKALDD